MVLSCPFPLCVSAFYWSALKNHRSTTPLGRFSLSLLITQYSSFTINGCGFVRRRVHNRQDICMSEVPSGARVMGHLKPHPSLLLPTPTGFSLVNSVRPGLNWISLNPLNRGLGIIDQISRQNKL